MTAIVIPAKNTLHIDAAKTYLSNNEVAGTNNIRWKNPNGFSASYAVQIGEVGHEQSEVKLLGTAAVAGTAGTLTSTTDYEHPADTPVYSIKYNQVVFARSTTGTGGSPTVLSGGTVTYSPDRNITTFEDSAGSLTYAYRVYFQNSVTLGTSDFSDWWIPTGFEFYSLARIRQRIKDKLWSSTYVRDDTIDDWINELKDEFTNAVISANEAYAMGTVDVAFAATTGLGTVTTNDFSQIGKLEVTYNGVDWVNSTKQDVNDYDANKQFSASYPKHNWEGDTVFRIKPSESGGTARMTFYRFGTTMVNDTDTLPLQMRSFTKSFVDYGQLQAQYKDEKVTQEQIDLFLARETMKFVSNVVPRDQSGPQYVDQVEMITPYD